MMEVETKLVPPSGFSMPGLLDVVVGTRPTGGGVGPAEPVRLVARYFDTDDLALARSSITLRYRSDPSGGRWTVKLPARSRKSHHLARREVDVDGPETDVPRALLGLLTAQLRGRTPTVVATLVTSRVTQRLTTSDGAGLVEVAVDHVCGTRTDGPVLEFDEVEVEQLDGFGAKRARRAMVTALRSAGCRRGSQVPKLMRVLGTDQLGPPDVVVPTLPPEPTVHEAVGHAMARSLDQLLFHDPRIRLGGDEEDLHQFRVAVRRLRSDLRTFVDVLDVLDRPSAAALARELGWLADATSARRDLDVLRARLVAAKNEVSPLDTKALEKLVDRCDLQAEQAGAMVLEALESRRYVDLLDALVKSVAGLADPDRPGAGEVTDKDHLRAMVRRRWKKLDRHIAHLERDPSPAVLHRTRIVAKRCRAALGAARPILGSRSKKLERDLGGLQDVLGDVHDCEVAQEWLRLAAKEQWSTALVAGQLVAGLRAEEERGWNDWPEAWKRVEHRRRRRR